MLAEGLSYTNIGHGLAALHSTLWLYRNSRLETHSAATGTHNSVWGAPAMHFWRGRFDRVFQ